MRLPPIDLSRRSLLAHGSLGALAAAMAVPVAGRLLSPTEARVQGAPLTVLTQAQASQLETLGEVMLPGAREAGIAPFVDAQLGRDQPLLMIRYFDWPGPLPEFYASGLAALDAASRAAHGADFAGITPDQQADLAGSMLGGEVLAWDGPPPTLFYLAVRSDAVDVTYGTVEGFDRLGIPYLPHIAPAERW